MSSLGVPTDSPITQWPCFCCQCQVCRLLAKANRVGLRILSHFTCTFCLLATYGRHNNSKIVCWTIFGSNFFFKKSVFCHWQCTNITTVIPICRMYYRYRCFAFSFTLTLIILGIFSFADSRRSPVHRQQAIPQVRRTFFNVCVFETVCTIFFVYKFTRIRYT